jgi:alpha-tubulin suppressor-like RCC1 family protein
VIHVALGTAHALAVGASGALYGWGGGLSGQNGHGFNTQVDQPKLIKAAAGVRFTAVAAGKLHSLALSRRAPFPQRRLHTPCFVISILKPAAININDVSLTLLLQ